MTQEERAAEIAVQMAEIERRLAQLQGGVIKLGGMLHEYAASSGLSPYQTAEARGAYGHLAGVVGEAMVRAKDLHEASAMFDPRPQPQSGGGGK